MGECAHPASSRGCAVIELIMVDAHGQARYRCWWEVAVGNGVNGVGLRVFCLSHAVQVAPPVA